MPPSGVDYASEFLNGYAPEYVWRQKNLVETNGVYYLDKRKGAFKEELNSL